MARNRRQRSRRGQRAAPAIEHASQPREPGQALARRPDASLAGRLGGGTLPRWAAGGGLALLVALAYWPALFAGFVWDDSTFIVEDPQVGSWGGLWDIWFNPLAMAEFHYWPVLYSTFWLEHKLWGFEPFGYHATNLVLHGVNTALLWGLLVRLGVPGAWLIAAVFAVHPVHVEAVAWVIARKDLLATCFYLLAFGAWLRFRAAGAGGSPQGGFAPAAATMHGRALAARAGGGKRGYRQGRFASRGLWQPRVRAYLAMLALYAAGGLSKSVALSLPAALLVCCWWQAGRIGWRDLPQVAPLVLLGIGIAAFDLSIFTAQAVHEFEYSLAERVIIAAKALWFYAGKLLWPHPLLFMYPHWDVNPLLLANWLAPAAALGLAGALWLARRRLGRGALAGALFFAITLAPVLGFADFGYMKFSFAADRYQYLPGIGLLAVLLGGAAWLYARLLAAGYTPYVRDAGRGMAALLLAVCGALSFIRIEVYQSETGLFRHIVATNPAAPSAWFNLGTLLLDDQLEEQAVAAFQEALALYPKDANAYINLSSALMKLERPAEALEVLQRAALLKPEDFGAAKAPRRARFLASGVHYNIGNALQALERPAEAAQAYRKALAVDPGNAAAKQSLVTALHQQAGAHYAAGRYAQALDYYQRSIAVDPSNAQSHSNLGSVLGQLRRFKEAAASFERALALDPQLESARANLRAAQQAMKQSLSE